MGSGKITIKKIVVSIAIICLMSTIVSTVEAAEIIVPVNQSSIQDAVDFAASGDTIIIQPGNYTENVVVDKQLIIKSDSGNPDDTIVSANNSSSPVFLVTANNVEISGLQIKNSTGSDGIRLEEVTGCKISRNKLTNNKDGILLDENSNNNSIQNNYITSNNDHGIILDEADRNTISLNVVRSNTNEGLKLENNSTYNTISSNSVTDNLEGICLETNCDNNTIRSNVASYNNDSGIHLKDSNSNSIISNVATQNNYGLRLTNSPTNTLRNNVLFGNLISNTLIE